MKSSTVYLVGAGPGDSKLITIKGLELIKKADCIIYDYLVNKELLKYRRADCKLIYAGKQAGRHTMPQEGINRLLAHEAKTHHTVVRLKGGDPFIFGRGAEEVSYLEKRGIGFEIVPGITSAIAVPTYAGIPLTERTKTSTVGFITGHEDPSKPGSGIDWPALAKALGTMVFLMGVGNIDSIAKRLIAAGRSKDTPVAVIRWGTTARQRTVTGTLRNIAQLVRKNKIAPPAIIVVGETVKFRRQLNWFETKPLFAKRIIVTRTREQASALSERLAALGAEVIEIPTIEIVSLGADKKIFGAFSQGPYDWIFFTSQNGVGEFALFLERTGNDSRIFGRSKICAIGPETAKALGSIGIKPDYVPPQFVAESIVRHFKEIGDRHLFHTRNKMGGNRCLSPISKVLILRAKRARDILPEGLKRKGYEVNVVDLYDTAVPKASRLPLNEAMRDGVDLVTFTSSSTVENFMKLLGRDRKRKLSGIKLASIGPVTSGKLKEYGLKPDIEAKVYTIEGLVDAIMKGNKA